MPFVVLSQYIKYNSFHFVVSAVVCLKFCHLIYVYGLPNLVRYPGSSDYSIASDLKTLRYILGLRMVLASS